MPARIRMAWKSQGLRLLYTRGPVQCLDEENFRREVAIASDDGDDHFDATAPEVLRVWFEKIPGGYRGTIEYTDAQGQRQPLRAQTYDNCEVLGRIVGTSAYYYFKMEEVPLVPLPAPVIPSPPPPAATPPPTTEPRCPVCGTPQPPAPPSSAPPPRRMDLTVGLNTYVMMTAFLSADVGPAVGVAGSVGGEVFSVNAELRAVLPSRVYAREPIPGVPASATIPVDFDLSQFTALVVPCARWKYLFGCAVGQFGFFHMKTAVQERDLAAFALGPRIGFEVAFAERFAVFGFGEALITPSPGGFQFDLPYPGQPDGPVANTRWVQPLASGFFGVGLSVKFK